MMKMSMRLSSSSLSLSGVREETARKLHRALSLPFLLLLSLPLSARVLLSGDRKATNILILIVFCVSVKKNVCVL